jgi:PAS domain S-box-containing protein
MNTDRSTRYRVVLNFRRTLLYLFFATFLVQFFVIPPLFALDPTKPIKQYIHTVWGYENGLPQNNIQSVKQTRDGYLWLASQEGIVRFDCIRFTVFERTNTPGIMDNAIFSLLQTSDGSLWAGTKNGLIRMQNGTFRTYTKDDGMIGNDVVGLSEDNEGSLWVAIRDVGVSVFKNGKFINYSQQNSIITPNINCIYTGIDGTMFIGATKELYKFKDGVFSSLRMKNKIANSFIRTIWQDTDGTLWLGMSRSGVLRYKNGIWKPYNKAHGLSSDEVRSLYRDRDDNLWIGTTAGINRLHNDVLSSYTFNDGLSGETAMTICEDFEGNLWVGTSTGGIDRFSSGKFDAVDQNDGLGRNEVRPIYQARNGAIWIGTNGGGLSKYANGKIKTYTTKDGLSFNGIRTICEDTDGTLWIGTSGKGICRFKDGTFKTWTSKDGLAGDYIFGMLMSSDHTLWVGTRYNGISTFKDGKFINYSTDNGLPNNAIRTIHQSKDGTIWVCTGGGLVKFRDGKWTTYSTREGLSYTLLYSLYEDNDGVFWIGSYVGGLFRFKDNKFTAFTKKDGLYDNGVFQILEDDYGYLWMTCDHGIFRVSKKELNDFAEGRASLIHSMSFGTTDGMKNSKCDGSSQPAGIKTQDRKLWIPTLGGVVIVDPAKVKQSEIPPPVILEQMHFDKKEFTANQALQVGPGKGDLEFQYTAINFTAPAKLRFKYMLVGFDNEWVDVGTRRTAYYTNIPPGDYTFRVIACNQDGTWNTAGAELLITIAAHYYQTRWFFMLAAVAVATFVFVTYRLRTVAIRRRQQELIQTVDERTKTLQAEIIQHKQTEERLQESEERYRKLVEFSPDAIAVHNNGKFVYVNPKMLELIGKNDASQIIGTSVYDFTHPDSLDLVQQRVQAGTLHRKALPPMEEKFVRADGTIIELETTSIPIIFEGSPSTQIVARDITEQKKLREELLQSQKIQGLGTLAGGIAHDFNNLLGIIIGYASLLKGQKYNPEKQAMAVQAIEQAADRGSALVRQILTFARKTDIAFYPVGVAELIREVFSMLKQTLPRTINFQEEFAPDIPKILADRTQLHQALLNLCLNARDAMPNGGTITIKAELCTKEFVSSRFTSANYEQYAQITVSDTGEGIEEANQHRIFDPFFTTKEKGKGTGLGLSVVYGIMQAHQGYVYVISEPGKGAAFSLLLPVKNVGDREPEESLSKPEYLPGGTETILIVEDEPPLIDMTRMLLESKGYNVMLAADGIEALTQYKEHQKEISLVLTDIGLPKMDGVEEFTKLKELNPDIKVIMASGYYDPEIKLNLMHSGVKGFIQKPYTPELVLLKIREVLNEFH